MKNVISLGVLLASLGYCSMAAAGTPCDKVVVELKAAAAKATAEGICVAPDAGLIATAETCAKQMSEASGALDTLGKACSSGGTNGISAGACEAACGRTGGAWNENKCNAPPGKFVQNNCWVVERKTGPVPTGGGSTPAVVHCPDTDKDGIPDGYCGGKKMDNCPQNPNPDQLDTDKDGFGDVCQPVMRGTHQAELIHMITEVNNRLNEKGGKATDADIRLRIELMELVGVGDKIGKVEFYALKAKFEAFMIGTGRQLIKLDKDSRAMAECAMKGQAPKYGDIPVEQPNGETITRYGIIGCQPFPKDPWGGLRGHAEVTGIYKTGVAATTGIDILAYPSENVVAYGGPLVGIGALGGMSEKLVIGARVGVVYMITGSVGNNRAEAAKKLVTVKTGSASQAGGDGATGAATTELSVDADAFRALMEGPGSGINVGAGVEVFGLAAKDTSDFKSKAEAGGAMFVLPIYGASDGGRVTYGLDLGIGAAQGVTTTHHGLGLAGRLGFFYRKSWLEGRSLARNPDGS